MSTIIKFDLKELRKLSNDKNSCVIEKRVNQNLALQPWCLGNLKESVKNLLDYKIGKFDREFNGILLSYKNLRILQNTGVIRNDKSDIHFQTQADYFIFKPYVGATLKGIVNKKSTTHLGILVHRVFNVVIPRPTEEPGNKWLGVNIREGEEVVFRIVMLDLYGALPYIRGQLDENWVKLCPEGDDEITEMKPIEPINVSYINFDKTKPVVQREMGDGLTHSENSPNISKAINRSKEHKKHNLSNFCNNTSVPNGRNKLDKTKSNESENEINVKSKKKSNKLLGTDEVDVSPRPSKKCKRDL